MSQNTVNGIPPVKGIERVMFLLDVLQECARTRAKESVTLWSDGQPDGAASVALRALDSCRSWAGEIESLILDIGIDALRGKES